MTFISHVADIGIRYCTLTYMHHGPCLTHQEQKVSTNSAMCSQNALIGTSCTSSCSSLHFKTCKKHAINARFNLQLHTAVNKL